MDHKLVNAFTEFPTSHVRNVSVIAHVDHGKTSLADHLISLNGIISTRLAGQLRYMDSREDEQERGITMKSSAITLLYDPLLLNLVDSPGHVDFCSEVDFAIQVTDNALLIVDVVEGVCPQTEALLRQAINNKLELILVINKIDRLVVELKLSEAEAYRRILRLLEHINSCISQTLQGQLAEAKDWQLVEEAEAALHFNPAKWNVLFTSSLHGYGFSLDDFASMWKKKLKGFESSQQELCADLFSFDKYLDVKTMSVVEGAERKGRKPLFQQLVLEPLWEVHKCGLVEKDLERLKQLAAKLTLPPLKARRIDEAFVEFMRQWIPLNTAVIKACARGRPASKAFASDDRIKGLMWNFRDSHTDVSPLSDAIRSCDSASNYCALQVAKFIKLNERRVALVRVLCGVLRQGTTFHPPVEMGREREEVHIRQVSIALGKDLIPCESAPSGRVCVIELASDEEWFRTGTNTNHTLFSASVPDELSEFPLDFDYNTALLSQDDDVPLVQVTVQPMKSGVDENWKSLRACLKTLSLMDKSMRVVEKESGDLVLIAAGEIHLQKCLKDLHDMGETDIVVSNPIVPFMETIIVDDQQPATQGALRSHLQECSLTSGQSSIRLKLRAVPLPSSMLQIVRESEALIEKMRAGTQKTAPLEVSALHDKLLSTAKRDLPGMRGTWWWRKPEAKIEELLERIWSFGPSSARANLLLNDVDCYKRPSIWNEKASVGEDSYRPLDRAIVAGFDLAVLQGPLCDEPMQGVAIVVEGWDYLREADAGDADDRVDAALFPCEPQHYGQMISAFKQCCVRALKLHHLRLVAAMYKCVVQTSNQAIGKVQNVLYQRRAKVTSEDVNEINGLLELQAFLPVVESFSFCDLLRKKTSGLASAQLRFSHWQVIDQDPFWLPTTEEEREEFGQMKVTAANQARLYVDAVRRRKGLPIDELIVQDAEKQRTLKKNK